MAKRFIDDRLFDDEWFMDLPGKYKLLWIYLFTKCTHFGIIKVNYKVFSFFTGEPLEPSEVKRILADRIVELEGGNKWFLPKFITFQYPTGINSDKPAIKSVRENLMKESDFRTIRESLPEKYRITVP